MNETGAVFPAQPCAGQWPEVGWGEGRKPFLEEEIRSFDRQIRELAVLRESPAYVVEPLVPGVAAGLVYEQGSLRDACILEGPHRGADVTRTIRTILSVPLGLASLEGARPVPDRLAVWGTVYMESAIPGSGPIGIDRVAAHLLEPDLRVPARQPLNLFCHGVLGPRPAGERLGAETHYERMLALQQWGLRVNRPHIRICRDVEEVMELCRGLRQDRSSFPYAMDGVWITLNSPDLRTLLEEMPSSPGWAIAFMYEQG